MFTALVLRIPFMQADTYVHTYSPIENITVLFLIWAVFAFDVYRILLFEQRKRIFLWESVHVLVGGWVVETLFNLPRIYSCLLWSVMIYMYTNWTEKTRVYSYSRGVTHKKKQMHWSYSNEKKLFSFSASPAPFFLQLLLDEKVELRNVCGCVCVCVGASTWMNEALETPNAINIPLSC